MIQTVPVWTALLIVSVVSRPIVLLHDLRGQRGTLLVARDELDVLDTSTVGDADGADDLAAGQGPEAESVSLLNAEGRDRLENAQRHDKVGCQDDVLLEVNAQTVRGELRSENVELLESARSSGSKIMRQNYSALNILRPLVDDVALGVGLDETAWRGTQSASHVGDEETTSHCQLDSKGY